MQSVVYNTTIYHLLFVSVLYSMYINIIIIIKLLSYYYYLINIFSRTSEGVYMTLF